ncbi:MAG TPA: DUF1513 domain-containing protein [Bdellovibrionota bacterium]|jgi:hypothetical protein
MQLHSGIAKQNRREFLKISGALVLGGTLAGCTSWSFLGGRKSRELIVFPSDPVLVKNGLCYLYAYEKTQGMVAAIPIPLELPHGCFSHPREPHRVYVVEQGGPRACEVNLETKAVRLFRLEGEYNSFYGHGTFHGDFLLTTEVEGEGKQGKVTVRRADDFKAVDVIPSFGRLPHDLRLIGGSKVLVVANHGNDIGAKPARLNSCVSYVDLDSKKLLHRCEVEELDSYASHLEVLAGDEVLVGCRKTAQKQDEASRKIRQRIADPATHMEAMKDAWRTFEYQQAPLYWLGAKGERLSHTAADFLGGRMRNTLSLAYGAGVLGITHLEGGIVSFWDVKTKQLKKVLELPAGKPHGIGYLESSRHFVIGLVTGLAFVDAGTLELHPEVMKAPFGVHLRKVWA